MRDMSKIGKGGWGTLSDEEQKAIIKELKEDLGGCEVDLKLFCPTEVKEWWEGKAKEIVDGGQESIQLLMSHLFLAILKNSLNNPVDNFNETVAIALSILRGDVKVRYKTPEDTLNTEVESNEDISKETFH
jgi:hypothetical protein